MRGRRLPAGRRDALYRIATRRTDLGQSITEAMREAPYFRQFLIAES
jgi:hypothetical protein